MRFTVLVLLASGCVAAEEPGVAPLSADFGERIVEGYSCGVRAWYAFDAHDTLRVGLRYATDLDAAAASYTLPDELAAFTVYTGTCLYHSGCSDVLSIACTQHVSQEFEATAGAVELARGPDDAVSGVVTDLVLTDAETGETVEVPELELPPMGPYE